MLYCALCICSLLMERNPVHACTPTCWWGYVVLRLHYSGVMHPLVGKCHGHGHPFRPGCVTWEVCWPRLCTPSTFRRHANDRQRTTTKNLPTVMVPVPSGRSKIHVRITAGRKRSTSSHARTQRPARPETQTHARETPAYCQRLVSSLVYALLLQLTIQVYRGIRTYIYMSAYLVLANRVGI